LTLSDKRGNIINKFTYPNSTNDISYGYVKRKYNFMNNPTPKKKNSSKIKYQKISNDEIFINEYIVSNKQINYNSNGEYNDFVELYNISMKDIKLENIYLTDDENNLTKYKLPTATIRKNNFLLIYLGEKSSVINNQIIANFKLSQKDKYIIVSNGKKIIDKVEIVLLNDNVSYGKIDNKWYYCDLTLDCKYVKNGEIKYCLLSKKECFNGRNGSLCLLCHLRTEKGKGRCCFCD